MFLKFLGIFGIPWRLLASLGIPGHPLASLGILWHPLASISIPWHPKKELLFFHSKILRDKSRTFNIYDCNFLENGTTSEADLETKKRFEAAFPFLNGSTSVKSPVKVWHVKNAEGVTWSFIQFGRFDWQFYTASDKVQNETQQFWRQLWSARTFWRWKSRREIMKSRNEWPFLVIIVCIWFKIFVILILDLRMGQALTPTSECSSFWLN